MKLFSSRSFHFSEGFIRFLCVSSILQITIRSENTGQGDSPCMSHWKFLFDIATVPCIPNTLKDVKYMATFIKLQNKLCFLFSGCWSDYLLLRCYVEPAKLIYMYTGMYMIKKNKIFTQYNPVILACMHNSNKNIQMKNTREDSFIATLWFSEGG